MQKASLFLFVFSFSTYLNKKFENCLKFLLGRFEKSFSKNNFFDNLLTIDNLLKNGGFENAKNKNRNC